MSIKQPLVLGNGLPQQLQPQDELQVTADLQQLHRLFQQLLISCALQGVTPLYEELQAELSIAMEETQ
jgi:hypothetical protein